MSTERVPAGTPGATLRGPKMLMSVKYSEESRFLYGGATLEFDDGRTEARVFAPLVYDGCWMTSIAEFSGEVGGVGGKRGALIKAVKESGSEAVATASSTDIPPSRTFAPAPSPPVFVP